MNDNNAQPKSEEVHEEPVDQVTEDVSEQMIPKARLDKVIEQREKALEELNSLKEKVETIDALKEEIENLKQSVTRKDDANDTFTKEEEDALSRIDKGLRSRGYLTKEEFEEQRRIEFRNSEINRLSSKYVKGSGYPEFKPEEVLVYAKKRGFGDNLESAYRDMHWEAITQMIAKKGISEIEPPDSEKPIGGDRQKATGLSTSEIAEMDINEYEKSRNDIMTKFRKSIFGK